MSYNVYLEVDGECVTEWHNYTYNVGPMLRLAWDGAGMNDLDGKSGAFSGWCIANAIDKMERDADRFDLLNPENGWGDRLGCIEWLRQIMIDCVELPGAKVRVT